MYYQLQLHHYTKLDEYKVDLSEEELITRIINPYQKGYPIVINGRTIDLGTINRIRIFETTESLENIINKFKEEHKKDTSPFKNLGPSPTWKAIESGKDVTDKYITGPAGHLKKNVLAPLKLATLKKGKLQQNNKNIFVVHGHDNDLKNETCLFLAEIGFDPIVLHRQPDGGLTIIEKFEKYSDVRYAIVLLTPDDYGFPVSELKKSDKDRKGKFRARQNVIFELGFFIEKLGRKSVCCLFKGIELPSDLKGLIYKQVKISVEEVGYEIIKELKNAGLQPKIS